MALSIRAAKRTKWISGESGKKGLKWTDEKMPISKENAARALTSLAEEHLKFYPLEERERRIKTFG